MYTRCPVLIVTYIGQFPRSNRDWKRIHITVGMYVQDQHHMDSFNFRLIHTVSKGCRIGISYSKLTGCFFCVMLWNLFNLFLFTAEIELITWCLFRPFIIGIIPLVGVSFKICFTNPTSVVLCAKCIGQSWTFSTLCTLFSNKRLLLSANKTTAGE